MNNTNKKLKFGRGGKRNRQRKARMERRGVNNKEVSRVGSSFESLFHELGELVPSFLTKQWDETIARKAFELWKSSGKTQKAFAEENGFPASRFRHWKSKIAV